MYKTNKMQKILVIRLSFPLDVLHVSDYISPLSGATFYKLYIVFGICRYQIRHTAYKKIAPEDGLIQCETCRAYIEK